MNCTMLKTYAYVLFYIICDLLLCLHGHLQCLHGRPHRSDFMLYCHGEAKHSSGEVFRTFVLLDCFYHRNYGLLFKR
jgi:hypothetical protein